MSWLLNAVGTIRTPSKVGDRLLPSRSSGPSALELIGAVREGAGEWKRRLHYRSELRRLIRAGAYLIADIGLTLEEAHREIDKPFWRP